MRGRGACGIVELGLDSRVMLGGMPIRFCGPGAAMRCSRVSEVRGVHASVFTSVTRNTDRMTSNVTTNVGTTRRSNGFCMVTLNANSSLGTICRRLVHHCRRGALDFHGIIMFGTCRCCPLRRRDSLHAVGRLGRHFLDRMSIRRRGVFSLSNFITRSTMRSYYHLCRRHVGAFKNLSMTLVNVNHSNGVTTGRPNSNVRSIAHLVLVNGASHRRVRTDRRAGRAVPPYSLAVNVTALLSTGAICLAT